MNFLDEYIKLTETNQWDKALTLIEHIITLNPNISTSWFNYGVCLEALAKHKGATQAFLNAYQIDQENYNAQYRIFRSLALANDEDGFKKFLSEEIIKTPEIAELLREDLTFADMTSNASVQKIIKDYTNR